MDMCNKRASEVIRKNGGTVPMDGMKKADSGARMAGKGKGTTSHNGNPPRSK